MCTLNIMLVSNHLTSFVFAANITAEDRNLNDIDLRAAPRVPNWAWKKYFKKFTKSRSGCPCWFDLGRGNDCACCKGTGIQCGSPMESFCQRDATQPTERKGCKYGIRNWAHTLSETGHPCHYDTEDKSCGWCALGSLQCNALANWNVKCSNLQTFAPGWGTKYGVCLGVPLDCRLNPNFCDPNARCVNTRKKTGRKYGGWVHRCACKNGYVGNGITCVEMSSGQVTVKDDLIVNMTMKIGPTIIIDVDEEVLEDNFPLGSATTDFQSELTNLESGNDANVVFCDGS